MTSARRPGISRRVVLAAAAAGALPGGAWGQLRLPPRPQAAFSATALEGARAGLGAAAPLPGAEIRLEVPEIATEPRIVAAVWTALPGVQQVAVLVDRAANPLVALVRPLSGFALPLWLTLDLPRTSRVIALVQAGDRWYQASHEVKLARGSW